MRHMNNSIDQLIDLSRNQNLYFVAPKGVSDGKERIIYLPKGWCDEFTRENGFAGGFDDIEDGPTLYGYIGNPEMFNWKGKTNKEVLMSKITGWITIGDLLAMKQVNKSEACSLDPDLFELLDAIDSGVAT